MSTEPRGSPVLPLIVALALVALTIVGFSAYTAREIRRLRDEQTAISERNRLDALQISRIQQNLATVGATLRDMLEGAQPYPLSAWANTFARLRLDLDQAIARERELAPADRPPAQQARLDETVRRFWEAMDRAFAEAEAGRPDRGEAIVRGDATARHSELVSLASQLFLGNTTVEQEAAARARAVYDRAAREIYLLAAVLVLSIAVGGFVVIRATRRAFDAVQMLSAERRALSWRMLRLQEDLQTSLARELHDEFGQILTAIGMMLARLKKKAPQSDPLALTADLEEIQQLAQSTLERIRTQSRLLHPVVLDDFGVERALAWYVEQFARQHDLKATFEPQSDLGAVPPDRAIHLYRIVQEALNNVARHAGATRAAVSLGRSAAALELVIDDDGRGQPDEPGESGAARGGLGITSMRERAELMGGSLTLSKSPLGGLRVAVRVPAGRVGA